MSAGNPFGVTADGALWEATDTCTCAFPDCGGYSMHEPHCGLELIGYLPLGAQDEPELLPSMLWDFSSIDHYIRMEPRWW